MDWKSVIKAIAPTVATAIAGPLGGGVIAAIGEIVGIDDPTQEKIKNAIENQQLSGEHIAKLKELEMRLQSEERERGFRYEELDVKDRSSARGMQVSTQSFVPAVIAFLIIACFFGCVAAVAFGVIEKSDLLVSLTGTLSAAFIAVMNFYFGSSSSSRDKDQMIYKSTPIA